MNRNSSVQVVASLVMALAASPAFAHTGLHDAGGLAHGIAHPLTGLDHILAMLAVGIWAALMGGRALWLVPMSFLAAMTLAAAFAGSGVVLPFMEQAIIVSVIALGLMIAGELRLPVSVGMTVVSLFALAHGAAHGAELPAGASGLAYGAGFFAATLGLHVAGIMTGLILRSQTFVRLIGSAIALVGVGLAYAA